MDFAFPSLIRDADSTFSRASRGMGHEFAKQLLAAGHTVVATTRSRSPALDGLAAAYDGKLIVITCDLASAESVSSFGQQLAMKVSHIDVLINNAGKLPSYEPECIIKAFLLLF
jgi:NAD(P)-dependent dehydrogenase (short-subunit alcohol dehydrogenase family)